MSYESALAQLKKLKRGQSGTDKTDKSPLNPPSVSFVSSQLGTSENFFSGDRGEQQPDNRSESDPDSLPLAAKLRAYGEPWPLRIDDRVVYWLIPDEAAAKRFAMRGPTYTADEARYLSTNPADPVLTLVTGAVRGLPIKPSQVIARLAPEDIDDIRSGHMQPANIRTFTESLIDETRAANKARAIARRDGEISKRAVSPTDKSAKSPGEVTP